VNDRITADETRLVGLVRPGESISRGQVIGKVGDTGSLEGPQLYFELRHKGKPQDPLAWLQPRTP
jgi:septal ring factor EnvC (AmiA/AmiB activator)